MKSARAKPLAVLVGVFLLGSVAGAAGSRAYMLHQMRSRFAGPPHEVRAHLRVEALRRQLDLSEAQVQKIEAIFTEVDGELERITTPCRGGVDELRKRTDERIMELLDEDQRTRFTAFAERRKRMPFPPPPGPPPDMPPP
jgi:hypothetical protein